LIVVSVLAIVVTIIKIIIIDVRAYPQLFGGESQDAGEKDEEGGQSAASFA
jgi:hypothetical protein